MHHSHRKWQTGKELLYRKLFSCRIYYTTSSSNNLLHWTCILWSQFSSNSLSILSNRSCYCNYKARWLICLAYLWWTCTHRVYVCFILVADCFCATFFIFENFKIVLTNDVFTSLFQMLDLLPSAVLHIFVSGISILQQALYCFLFPFFHQKIQFDISRLDTTI